MSPREPKLVPDAEPRSYYGRPVVKSPVWKPEIPWYLLSGGIAGATATFAFALELHGDEDLARRAWLVSLAGISVSPVLLVSDIGRPERFFRMLRVFKPTSPMNVGSWILTVASGAISAAAGESLLGFPRGAGRAAKPVAAALGLSLATYTAVLIANSAIPVWSDARRYLPFVFASGAATTGGAAVALVSPMEIAAPARRLALGGAAAELVAVETMRRGLGDLAENYKQGAAGRYSRLARVLGGAGAALLALRGRRSRAVSAAGAAMLIAGGAARRWSVFKAGFQSAEDPAQTVGPQRRRASSY
jgi:formate-dependent nitrite reductase membrane component NrfD